jgi:hypothetical protein
MSAVTMTPLLTVPRCREILHHAPARTASCCPWSKRCLRGECRRMRRARRPLWRRQVELDPEDGLRQLRRRCRRDQPHPSRPAGRSRHRQSAHRARTAPRHASAMSASSCAPCRASRPSMSSPSPWSAAACRATRRRESPQSARPRQPAGAAVVAAARDLLRRRAAARQHRARLHHRSPGAAARRADGLARCRQSRRGGRNDREKKRAGVALLGIFHDEEVRAQVADRIVDVTAFAPRKAA